MRWVHLTMIPWLFACEQVLELDHYGPRTVRGAGGETAGSGGAGGAGRWRRRWRWRWRHRPLDMPRLRHRATAHRVGAAFVIELDPSGALLFGAIFGAAGDQSLTSVSRSQHGVLISGGGIGKLDVCGTELGGGDFQGPFVFELR